MYKIRIDELKEITKLLDSVAYSNIVAYDWRKFEKIKSKCDKLSKKIKLNYNFNDKKNNN